MITIKVAIISTGIAAMSLFVKSCVPIAVEFSLSRFPILWSSFLSWLKPPYLFVIINVIIVTTIVASSKYFQSTGELDCDMKDELVMLTWKLNTVHTITDESETKKPLVSSRFSHRKPVKVNKRKAARVVKPKWHENTLKMMMVTEELKSTPLTSHSWRHETLRLAAEETQPVLRESEIFRDMTNNYPMSPTVTQPVKMRKEMLPSTLEELNRRFEAFIKKGKEEILESLRLDKDVDSEAIEAY
ncbi:hypothetical protein N665_0469s0005 [Sinapis alba]|nr:hypothetical protein N665_0469s0005 [Sinapis alba]